MTHNFFRCQSVRSEVVPAHAVAENHVAPRQTFEFTAGLGAYSFHVAADDGKNSWSEIKEATWGMLKDGVAITIGTTHRLPSDF